MKYLRSPKVILFFILILGLFFRNYKLEIFYPWGHDQDLFAWIAKDIIVDHHLRLIGQETSITGVFIGPLFYYLIALAFAVFNMNPLSAATVTTIISLVTILSIYWVFTKFFSSSVGLIGSFLYAISPGVVFLDRWVVPTQPTILWSVWFMYVIFSILKGNWQILVLLSILLGLILHIHIAFIPLLILLPISFVVGKRSQNFKYSLKDILLSISIFLILISPFVLFEIRHGFSQAKSLINATYQDKGDITGTNRLFKVINSGGRSLAGAFLLSNTVIELPYLITIVLPFLLLLVICYLAYQKILSKEQIIIIVFWYLIVFLGQFISKRIITEYYFNNLFVILFLIFALILNQLNIFFKKIPVVGFAMMFYLVIVTIWFITRRDDLGGYLYKRQAIEYIKSDALNKGYQCVSINHIEGQLGGATGFRYLFWLNKLSIVTSGDDVPVYSIVEPWKLSEREISAKFGTIGVIVPVKPEMDDTSVCKRPDRQLLPLWGFNN